MEKTKKKMSLGKIVRSVITVLLVIWIALGAIDFFRVSSFDKPFFTLPTTESDGISGTYTGLGYSFDIQADENGTGIVSYEYSIFGIEITHGTKN